MQGLRLPRRAMLAIPIILALAPVAALGAECAHLDKMTTAELAVARKSGQRIVLAFGADWCPVCSRQGALLSRLANERNECNLLLVHLDIDENRDMARGFGVLEQGTVLGLHGEQEVARLVGATDAASIRAFLDKVRE